MTNGRPAIRFRWDLLGIGILLLLLLLLLLCVVPGNPHAIEKSKIGAALGDIGAFNSALALYQIDVSDSQFPRTTLLQLVSNSAPEWNGPYMATITNDPWDNCYTYTSDGTSYTVQSLHVGDEYNSETIRYTFANGVVEEIPPRGPKAQRHFTARLLILLWLAAAVARICLFRSTHPVTRWLNWLLAAGVLLWLMSAVIYSALNFR